MKSDSPPKHKYLEIAERIKKDILSGVYDVGERIPPIRRLSEEYGATPQTVNKATTYLASQGYLESRQGAGSRVTIPKEQPPSRYIGMLVDRSRSHWLTDREHPEDSHSRDIYFSYFMLMNSKSINADFFVYDKETQEVPADFQEKALTASGFFVQGTLPRSYFDYLSSHEIPTVLINRTVPEGLEGRFGAVMISEEKILDVLNYLVSMGHKRILFAFSREFEHNEVFYRRLERLKAACAAWGSSAELQLETFSFDIEDASTVSQLDELIEAGYSAAFGYNDVSALRLYPLLHAVKRRVPEEFSVVGFDDIIASNLASPPLTTLRVNRSSIIHVGYSIMEELISSRTPLYLEKVVNTELIIRKSVFVAPPPK